MQTEEKARDDIIEVGQRLYQKNLVAATDGNISIRLPGDVILITASGVSKGHLKIDDLIKTNIVGEKICGEGKPSSEILMHVEVYNQRPDVWAIVHAHPPTATAFSIAGVTLPQCVIPEVMFTVGLIPTTDFAVPTTEDVPKVVSKLIADHDAMILDRHGSLTVGKDVFDAFYKVERIEYCAQVTLIAKQLGRVRKLEPEQLSKIEELKEKMGTRKEAIQASSQCSNCGLCEQIF